MPVASSCPSWNPLCARHCVGPSYGSSPLKLCDNPGRCDYCRFHLTDEGAEVYRGHTVAPSHPANAGGARLPGRSPQLEVITIVQIERPWRQSRPSFVEYLPSGRLSHTGSRLCKIGVLSSERLSNLPQNSRRGRMAGQGLTQWTFCIHSLSWSLHVVPHCLSPWRPFVLMREKNPVCPRPLHLHLHPSKGSLLLPRSLRSRRARARTPGGRPRNPETIGPGLRAKHARMSQKGEGLWPGTVQKSPGGVAGRPSRTQIGGERSEGHL